MYHIWIWMHGFIFSNQDVELFNEIRKLREPKYFKVFQSNYIHYKLILSLYWLYEKVTTIVLYSHKCKSYGREVRGLLTQSAAVKTDNDTIWKHTSKMKSWLITLSYFGQYVQYFYLS